jgi:protocatechuate 3,4-dioxygenase beta subunit
MNLLDFTDRWVVPALVFLADWSMRWGVLLALLLLWLVLRPPRRASTRYLMTFVALASGVLLPVVPRWASIAIVRPSTPTSVAQREASQSATPIVPRVAGEADVTSTDGTVVALGTDRRNYARLLFDLARCPASRLPLTFILGSGFVPFLDRRTVATRIERLLEDDMKSTLSHSSAPRRIAVGILTIAVALCGGGIAVRSVEPQAAKSEGQSRREIKAEPAAATVRQIEGVILDPNGKPVAGAVVVAGLHTLEKPKPRVFKTDTQGRYHYRLPPGETYFYVMGPPSGLTRLPEEGSSITVTIPEGTDRYELPPIQPVAAVTLRGRLVDAVGSPTIGATVVGTCEGNTCQPFPGHERVTDARGEFKLPEGGYNTVAKGKPARLLIRLQDGIEQIAATLPSDDGLVTVKLAVQTGKPAGVEGPKDVGPDELAGVVVDAEGKPIEGVAVDAWTWYPGNETRTNSRGEFRLKKLDKVRKVEVVFHKPGYSPQLFVTQPTGTQGWVVVLGNKTYFEGTVTSPEGKPVAGALIRANQGPKTADGVVITEIWTEAKTDPEGRYRMYAQADVYDIQVRVPSVGVARLKDTTLGSDEAKQLDISLHPGAKFRAKVVDSLTGKPVVGVRLWHWQHKGIEGHSDNNGIVTIADMLPGPFAFSVAATGYARWWSDQSSTQWGRRQILPGSSGGPGWQRNFDRIDFELQPDMEMVTITLEQAVTITGEVRDPHGNAVAGATVAPALTGTGNSLTGDTRFSVVTDAKGRFEMTLPASGEREYNLVAHDGKYQQWRTWANGVQRPFTAKPGERRAVGLLLTRPARVRGRVVDRNGDPVAGREVRASAADRLENRYYDPTVKTAADGTFELKFVRPGEQFIQVAPFWLDARQGPGGSSQMVALEPDQTKEGLNLQVKGD